MFQLKLDSRIQECYPQYTALILYVTHLHNGDSQPATVRALREMEVQKRVEFGTDKATSNPHIAAWREVYGSFGVKPSKYPCSVEALLSRVLRGQDLPEINEVVDIYNRISLKYVLPVGGEDWDKLTSDLTLTFATGTEDFDTFDGGQEVIQHPQAGEVVWLDSSGVTCRAWNWRQCVRTRLTTDTKNAYFVLDRLHAMSFADLLAAGKELSENLQALAPDCTVVQEILGNQQ